MTSVVLGAIGAGSLLSYPALLFVDANDLCRLLIRLAQRRGEAGTDMIGRAAQRVGIEVSVALRRAGTRVPQELADDW